MNKRIVIFPAVCALALILGVCAGCSSLGNTSSSSSSTSSSSSSSTSSSASSSLSAEEKAKMPNPMIECSSSEDLQAKSGILLKAPAKAQDITYDYIEMSGIAQMEFVIDGLRYSVRGAKSDTFQNYSGMMYDWQNTRTETATDGTEITLDWTQGIGALALGLDSKAGIMYSVGCADPAATPEAVSALWSQMFAA